MPKTNELQSIHPMFVEPVALFSRMEEIQQEIARRAFELFEGRGRAPGGHFEDWSTAESELLFAVLIELAETDEVFKITAAVPSFTEKDIKIAAEPQRVFLSGKIEEELKSESRGNAGRRAWMFFRGIDLPAEIDLDKCKAQLKDGRLTLTLPKVPVGAGSPDKSAAAKKD